MAKISRKIVVKIGSSVIAPHGRLDSRLVSSLVKDILNAEKKGYKVVLVSSGAIACGLNRLGLEKRPKDIHSLMAISSLGQIMLMDTFNEKFNKHKRVCAQVLLVWNDFNDRKSFINIKKTIEKLISIGAIPIINENDVVSHEEIGFGDNDKLSALVADLIGADSLIILSDVEGLLDEKGLVKKVKYIDDSIKSLVKKQNRAHTKGGMASKLEAALKANLSGIKTRIAYGKEKNIITRIASGEDIGTLFVPADKVERSRKRWIYNKQIKGCLIIDEGAKAALLDKGRSLLSVGVTEATGSFNKGDAVAVVDPEGDLLGCGLTNYGSDRFKKGKQDRFEKEVVHRDNFAKKSEGWCSIPFAKYLKKQ